jgi:hypothetical protein
LVHRVIQLHSARWSARLQGTVLRECRFVQLVQESFSVGREFGRNAAPPEGTRQGARPREALRFEAEAVGECADESATDLRRFGRRAFAGESLEATDSIRRRSDRDAPTTSANTG